MELPRDNDSLRTLMESLLIDIDHDTIAEQFKVVKMYPTKKNAWDAVTPQALYAYLMRYNIFCDQYKDFYEAQFPDPSSRFSELYDLFCRGLQPECIRTAMHSVRRSIKDNAALKKRFVEQIERVKTVSSSTSATSYNARSNGNKQSSYVNQKHNTNNNNNMTTTKPITQASMNNTNNNIRSTASAQPQQSRPQPHISSIKNQQPASPPHQSVLSGGKRVSQVSAYYASTGRIDNVGRVPSKNGNTWSDGSPRTQLEVYGNHVDPDADSDESLCYEEGDYDPTADSVRLINNNNNKYALLDSGSSIHTVPSSTYLSSISCSIT